MIALGFHQRGTLLPPAAVPICEDDRIRYLVCWCFKVSQPQKITSGLKKTLKKIYFVKKINKAEIRPEEHSEKAESCQENLWNEIQLKGP